MLWLPGPGQVSCHWQEPNHDCHYIIPPFRSRPPGLQHTCINKRKPRRKIKPKWVHLWTMLISATNDQCPMSSLTAESVNRGTPPPAVGSETLFRWHQYWPEIHKKLRKSTTLYRKSNPTSLSPITVEVSSDALAETHWPIPVHCGDSQQVWI